ncbi:CvpA family protein [Staphylococcus sp. NRL 16/872]|uniref:CvpA family protein n=1 Tax=Staphylococcus sp. NRL 16/872 TaxID=2930131 RepID=UPI001FB41DCB|nr:MULTISPECIES: CvpA family protein [unclassified Staphylococcus]MCJ1656592.1 CvpA family protein [Staphylococcus sp. NRL 21/187]MCJ1662346.1 CvpA family protein [Staphylococcus sp. NRL 18/288]MCJ1668431.1 CvpA family protein [Staphylococcus sp. NRL 19/737]WEN68643.1 CvpA family protein [Staphylococcus sp. NRL 16/872]
MLIDVIVVLIIIYYIVMGFRRGIWLSSLHLLASIVSLIIAHQFYRSIAKQLIVFLPFPKTIAYDTSFAFHFNDLQQRFDTIFAFILIMFTSKLLLYLIIVTFDNIVTYQNIALISRVLGCMLSPVLAIILLQIALYIVALYPVDWLQQSLSHSILGSGILFHTPWLSSYILNL